MENKVIDNKTRRYCLYIGLLACLVAVTAMAGHAAAVSYWNFDDYPLGVYSAGEIDGFAAGERIEDDPVHPETSHGIDIMYYYNPGGYITSDPQVAEYWSYTIKDHDGSGGGEARFWVADISGNYLSSMVTSGWGKVEIKKEGISYYSRINGGEWTWKRDIAATPYYYAFEGGNTVTTHFDDIVIGTSQSNDILTTIPDTWFVAKDMRFESYRGVYSSTETVAYLHDLNVKYVVSGTSLPVKVEHIDSGLVVCETTTHPTYWADYLTFNVTEMLFEADAPYGLYKIYVDNDNPNCIDTFEYRSTTLSGTIVEWDDTEYVDGDTGTLSFSISETYWMTDDYTYKLVIEDADFTDMQTWSLITRPVSAEKSVSISTTLFPASGYYYACLYAVDKSSGEEILMCYDDAYILLPGSGDVWVDGVTYDATTNLTLVSCTVTATQLGVDHSTTSDAVTGAYEITSGLVTDWSLGMNASKTGYIGYLMAFTPYEAGTYGVDIPLVPSGGPAPGSSSNATTAYYNSTIDGTALGGICYEGPYWTLGEGCNVTVSNSTWSTSCTTGAGGWYQCNNIGAGGTYTLSCSKSGYSTYSTSCSLEEGCFNREDCTLESSTDLNVECRELTSEGLITGTACTVTLSTGESCDTTNGTAVFSGLAYGYYEIAASAEGYYPGATSAVMDEGKTVSCYLQEKTEGGSGIAYAPKTVRFTVQNIWGKKIADCDVECQGYETTAGSFAWLYSLFGIDANETPIATAHMEGQTDYKGDINFLMLEPVKYVCNFTKTGEIDKTVEIYPKDDYYLILAEDYGNESWFDGGVDINSAINITVATSEVNATHAWINLTYLDSTGFTTGGTVYLNQTNTTVGGAPITLSTCSLSAGCEDGCNCTFLVQDYPGEGYILQVDPTHSVWDFERTFTVTFPEEIVNPLGLTGMELALISAGCVLFAGALFSAISAPMAPLIMSFVGWICFALGWLGAVAVPAFAGLVLASVLAIAYLIAIGSHKERWT